MLFALAAVVALAVPKFLGERLGAPDALDSALTVIGRILIAIAIGWTVTTIIDALIKRRMARLDLEAEDNLAARKMATRLDVIRRIVVVIGAFITLAILVNAIILGMDDPAKDLDEEPAWMQTTDWMFTLVFTLEMVIKMLSMGFSKKKGYFRCGEPT